MKTIRVAILLLSLFLAAGCGPGVAPTLTQAAATPTVFIYVAGQTGQNVLEFAQFATNTISALVPASTGTTLRPAAVLIHPSKIFAYVANFGSNDVTKYSRDMTTGILTPLGSTAPNPAGTGPISLATDSKGQFLYVLNQGPASSPGSISAFSVDTTRGLLTELAGSPFATPANPTAFAISPNSNFLYVANGTLHNISAFAIAPDGTLSAVAGSPFDTGAGSNISWVVVDPKGRFVYGADFANNMIVGFSLQANGALATLSGSPFIAGGTQPAGLAMDSNGAFVFAANQGSDSISVLAVASSGSLSAVSGSPFPSGGTQTTFVTVDPSNQFVYDTNLGSDNIGAASINATTGALTQLTGSPLGVGVTPSWIAVSK